MHPKLHCDQLIENQIIAANYSTFQITGALTKLRLFANAGFNINIQPSKITCFTQILRKHCKNALQQT